MIWLCLMFLTKEFWFVLSMYSLAIHFLHTPIDHYHNHNVFYKCLYSSNLSTFSKPLNSSSLFSYLSTRYPQSSKAPKVLWMPFFSHWMENFFWAKVWKPIYLLHHTHENELQLMTNVSVSGTLQNLHSKRWGQVMALTWIYEANKQSAWLLVATGRGHVTLCLKQVH